MSASPLQTLTSRLQTLWRRPTPDLTPSSILEARLAKLESEVAEMKRDRESSIVLDQSEIIVTTFRIPGQDQGKVWMSDDFNDPLPDSILNDFLNPL
jgi:hypothetical protein